MSEDNPPEEDTLKILIATDNHLGYGEKNPERCDDSFRAFEEILQLAVKHSVDFILLGGDLFHDANPSPYTIYKCLELLRRYCLGDKPVEIEFLSDQSFHFSHLSNPTVNYEDPNLNVSIPVFTIHGNHDDPIGQKQLSALDILSSAGLINYFGHWNDLTKVDVNPMLLQKGKTKLALYGMSHIKDVRLGRLFRDKKVTFFKPEGDWFNILTLHQNRCAGRGRNNFVPETVLPEFLDLVIWGHEHDCEIEVVKSSNNIFISQPGSSVATSLSSGESIPKKVGLLKIYEKKFKLDPIPLKTVRPFIYYDLSLASRTEDQDKDQASKTVLEHALNQVKTQLEKMIEEANQLQKDSPVKMHPLIRLVVHYADERQAFNAMRISQLYADRIANPEDAILLKCIRTKNQKKKNFDFGDDLDMADQWAERVEDVVKKYFESDEKSKMMVVCSVDGLIEAVKRHIDKNDTDALELVFEHQCQKTKEKVGKIRPELDDVEECLESLRVARKNAAEDVEEAVRILEDNNRVVTRLPSDESEDVDEMVTISDDDDNSSTVATPTPKPSRGRGSRGPRRGTSERARGRGRRAPVAR